MATVSPPIDFFRAGGTLHLSTPSYITRPADDELFNSVRAGHFCYILTSRQMGKSSLMIRTAARLRKEGVRTVIIDLSGLGTQLTASQWYLGIVNRLAEQLNLSVDMETWWQTRDALSVVQRFTDFIAEAVLVQTPDRVTIFFDEIDSTLKLGFTDDFFAAIRTFYNARANDPDYERLTFVLLGVATPTDLIKDRNRTPFNIGHAIDLGEFSHSDAQLLANGLEQAYPDCGNELLDRVFHWTSGHPYLTQKICHALVERIDQSNGTKAAEGIHNSLHVDTQSIDHLVHRLFLEIDAQNEDNLKFVHSNIQASTDRNRLLQIYRRVYNGTRVGEDERSPLHNRLKLIGLVRSCAGVLKVRNEIYRQVFNPDWIKQNTPVEWTRIITISSVAVTLVTIAFYLIVQFRQAEQHFDQLIITFENTDSIIDLRMLSLAKMCNLQPINARAVFYGQPRVEQLALLREVNPNVVDDELAIIARCLTPPPTVQLPQSNIVRIPPTPPVAPKLSSPEGTIQIVAKHSEKCLDVDVSNSDTNGMSNGTLVQQWDCLGQDQNNQLWSLISVGDYFQIVAKHSEKCLDVDVSDSDTNGMSNGTLVQQWDCLGQDQENQLWSLISVGDYFQIVAKHSEKCLDVDISNSDTNGMIDGTRFNSGNVLARAKIINCRVLGNL